MKNEPMTSYGVIRCARNVRRRREARARVVRRLLWVLLAVGVVCLLSGCEARESVEQALAGVVLVLSTLMVIGLVWMAVTEQGRQDRLGEAYAEEEAEECGVENAECRVRSGECGMRSAECGVEVENLRRIVGSCETEARRVRGMIESARRTMCLEDHFLREAEERQSMIIGCLAGLREVLMKVEGGDK